ncbi:MAG: hypothetical protein AVDCRST_MAG31-1480 [uncultured Sphingomonas sp.]|uniref:Uncharacterized protein n=1 Tax=uncultured Sphingomonas sp. TaxID=158754 RepID=A0A6J4TCZ8_9SPHN|nr:MAG: hypothetical protein AVDCRST_MAG31-1480 [uncultured Sphingomonas sp.]
MRDKVDGIRQANRGVINFINFVPLAPRPLACSPMGNAGEWLSLP